MTCQATKLVFVLTTFLLITIANIKAILIVYAIDEFAAIYSFKALASVINNLALLFKRILYIYYPMHFKKNQAKIQVLLYFGNKINVITLAYIVKLSLKV